MTRPYFGYDVSQLISESDIGVLPLGATEYHGPHLPAETDTIIAAGIADRLSEAVAAESCSVGFLPPEAIGYSPEHLDHPATRSMSYGEALKRWIGIGEALAAGGMRKLLMLNAHGGNSPLLSVVATELRVRCDMLCVASAWTRFEPPEGLFSESELAYGIHGGALETSVMLALAPDRVEMSNARDFANLQQQLAKSNRYLRAYGKHGFGWKMRDLNEAGAAGNATLATAEKGELLIANAVDGFRTLLVEMYRFSLDNFR